MMPAGWDSKWIAPEEVIAGWLMEFGMRRVGPYEWNKSTWFMQEEVPSPDEVNRIYPGAFCIEATGVRLTEQGVRALSQGVDHEP